MLRRSLSRIFSKFSPIWKFSFRLVLPFQWRQPPILPQPAVSLIKQKKNFKLYTKEKKDEEEEEQKSSKINWQNQFKFNYNNPNHRKILFFLLGATGIAATYIILDQDPIISYQDFLKNHLDRDTVKKIVIQKDNNQKTTATIISTNDEKYRIILGNVDNFLENLEKQQLSRGKTPDQLVPVVFYHGIDTNKWIDRSINLVYLGVSMIIAYSLFKSLRNTMNSMGSGGRTNDFFGFGKSNVKQFEQKVKIKFSDVAGLDEAKAEIREFVDFLKKPQRYQKLGAKVPRGALLSGPPGTGKTMLAKACAGEAGVPFFYISGSDFVEMFVGVGASRVRDLFQEAKKKSPSIVFIDEIDAVGRKREARLGGNDERDNTLNQLLVEMDGFGTDSNIIILAATNRAELLDPALTRPGRFDRTIEISLPDIEGRRQIFLVHLRKVVVNPERTKDEYARRLATLTPGFSGADIANLVNEAAILAARQNKQFVESIDFEMASERVTGGLEKKRIMSLEERKIVAYHESGHAVASWFLKGGHPLIKLTIIPRSKGSLGYTQYLPNESQLDSNDDLIDRICCILGGRVSEEIFFGKITTGAYDDLKKAYQLAHAYVTKFGMSEAIGYVGLEESEFQKPYSEQTNKEIDDEIKRIIDECTIKTRELLQSKKKEIDLLAKKLLDKDSLDLNQIMSILGERPFEAKDNYKAYLQLKKEDESKSVE